LIFPRPSKTVGAEDQKDLSLISYVDGSRHN
jgi:hypothetical protein